MSSPAEEPAPRYEVVEAEQVEIDRERQFLRLLKQDADYAGHWLEDIIQAIQELPKFPGLLSHAIDAEASALFGWEVRRMQYRGPGKRRSGQATWRVLFTILPSVAEADPTIIRVLRILHGAQSLTPEDGVAEE